MAVAMHAWAGGPCVMSNLHVAIASPNAAWMEIPRNKNPFAELLLAEPLEIEQGTVAAPTLPGLGVELPGEVLDAYPYRPGCHYYFAERRSVSDADAR
jgi:L-alanine-DL-glutamate epimerase-like enolase superfamily enzyme